MIGRHTNDNLEAMAKQLYDYWFVQFDFPNEEGKPYKSSGGEMVWNEKLKCEVPKNWLDSSLQNKDLYTSDFTANGSFASLAENVKYNEGENYALLVRIVDFNDDFSNSDKFIFVNKHAYDYLSKSTLIGGEIIVCNVGAAGATYICPDLNIPMTLGPNGIVLKANEYTRYLYLFYCSPIGQQSIKEITSGSIQPKFNKTDFRNMPLLFPPINIIEEFNKIIEPYFALKDNLWFENRHLTKHRDELLPLLMNGQASVNYHLYVFSHAVSLLFLCTKKYKTMTDFNSLQITSVNDLPGYHAKVAFSMKTAEVFKESGEISPRHLSETLCYMPWGADDQMPFDIIKLIESDETLSTCQMFNAEVCYGSGLVYDTDGCKQSVVNEVEEFALDNDLASYFLGVCQDFKHFGFAVSVVLLNESGTKVVRILRKEACYVRFAPANKEGVIPQVLYANWRNAVQAKDVEAIPLLNPQSPWTDLVAQAKRGKRKFAVVSRVPTPDSTYYPIPYYASLFKGKWYNIKQLIGIAKEAKLKNSAPIKYHIEIAKSFWANIFKAEGITDRVKQQERVNVEKDNIINFLTGMENSGKVLFSEFYVSPNGEEQHDVVINKIETDKEGGDWATDIIEAVNMMCFTMRVHSNLVGSVPGKTQTNNSGSDKRELYTIAQALQKPYHDLLFNVHRLIIRFNKWDDVVPTCPFIQLTTLDENKDAKQVSVEPAKTPEHE